MSPDDVPTSVTKLVYTCPLSITAVSHVSVFAYSPLSMGLVPVDEFDLAPALAARMLRDLVDATPDGVEVFEAAGLLDVRLLDGGGLPSRRYLVDGAPAGLAQVLRSR